MLQSYWPHLVADGNIPSPLAVVEITRVYVDRTLEASQRRVILPELLCAIHEILLALGGLGMVGVTRERLLTHFIRNGIQWLRPLAKIEGKM